MIYIGQTVGTAKKRWADHISTAKYSANGRFYRTLNKYGPEAFTVEVIAEASSLEELNLLEEQLISAHSCISPKGYNILPGGNNRRHHPETKQKLAKIFRGKAIPNRWDKGFIGNHTDETKAKN